MKQTLRYDQVSCRLRLEGLPDVSANQGADSLGIITGWSLEWAGRPELEGRKEHLVAMMQVVLPYARHLVSGIARPFGDNSQPVAVGPAAGGSGHLLQLRSSQSDVPPLELQLDDAELADLVRVLDEVHLDPRVLVQLEIAPPLPLKAREVLGRTPLPQRLAAPIGGAVVLALAAALGLMLPQPKQPQPKQSAAPAGAPGLDVFASLPTLKE
ncbi:DUF4335 domain-containing protein [Cyanobium sp. HWJ4-Hawea]|uniref:DUF4335 domain-containing protein n=1 Tax=Cyanobium sp. HWJ4-Hawea TaxID=2823713 RepID=UPI0020CDAD1E|nr:DUF4335 domain-containing protein [Cyanobium sp. HWJ4-Hawea]MCP9809165.1 DUF4335 domain-containing protein [Cyanobium sp. HWJ4-Hawea]